MQNLCFLFWRKNAVAGAFTQAKTSTNNFSENSRKIAKVNTLVPQGVIRNDARILANAALT